MPGRPEHPGAERIPIRIAFLWRRLRQEPSLFSRLSARFSSQTQKDPRDGALVGFPKSRFTRDSFDLGLLARRLLGMRISPVLLRVLPRGRFSLAKEHIVHAVILLIVGGVVLTNYVTEAADQGSILFKLFGEAEIEEGPLDTKALQERASASLGGGNVALVQAALAGGITEDDIEFELANTLGGNALVASNGPETSVTLEERRTRVLAYSVREGDTPSAVAARFGVSTHTILWANGITDGDIINPGDILVVLPVTGVLHTVQKGDDVARIAKRYEAKPEDILAQNGLTADADIRAGQKLIVPDGYIAPPRRVIAEEPEIETPEAPGEEVPVQPRSKRAQGPGLLWPTEGRTVSQYFRWGHTGIDIPNKALPPVYAADDGTVAFSGWLGGYGRLIIVDHGRGTKTYYAHLSKSYVGTGETVAKGQSIGRVGSSGRSSGSHLHFEIRKGGRPVNPLNHL